MGGTKASVTEVEVAGHSVRLSSPDRVLFPYYLAVGDGIMRALRDRPTTLQRFPDGIEGEAFFQKRIPTRGVPPWIRTEQITFPRGRGAAGPRAALPPRVVPPWIRAAQITFPGGRGADELCPADLAHVAWAAQMGTIVFHPWPVRAAAPDNPHELRIHLHPHEGTGFPAAGL